MYKQGLLTRPIQALRQAFTTSDIPIDKFPSTTTEITERAGLKLQKYVAVLESIKKRRGTDTFIYGTIASVCVCIVV